jgi:hypothetical protein
MITQANIPDPEAFYNALTDAYEGLSEAASADYNARLILLLANQVGDQTVLMQCIAAAHDTRVQL